MPTMSAATEPMAKVRTCQVTERSTYLTTQRETALSNQRKSPQVAALTQDPTRHGSGFRHTHMKLGVPVHQPLQAEAMDYVSQDWFEQGPLKAPGGFGKLGRQEERITGRQTGNGSARIAEARCLLSDIPGDRGPASTSPALLCEKAGVLPCAVQRPRVPSSAGRWADWSLSARSLPASGRAPWVPGGSPQGLLGSAGVKEPVGAS